MSSMWHSLTNKELRDAGFDDQKIIEHAVCQSTTSLEGKVTIVTGGNSGIGKESVRDFVRRGAKVILACRNLERGNDAKTAIEQDTGIYGKIKTMQLDLSSMKSVRKFADEYKQEEERLDILLNNAGMMKPTSKSTQDGFETIMATNHLGHFLLTNLLMELLIKCAPSRIVNVSSTAHYSGTDMMFNDFHVKRGCCRPSTYFLYSRSKAANVMFTRELHRRFSESGVTSYSCHPGIVKTNLTSTISCGDDCCFLFFTKCLLNPDRISYVKTATQGAQTPIYCCVQSGIESESGSYFMECKPRKAAKYCQNDRVCNELWNISSEIVGLNSY
ncbi:DgyrCDS6773 [Dimorphilus gyrociliatus]|uniref:DgyrCDS6773 n=1 Tax=Dimorphilus gyrociliatus TaxID=2664684 RepID=A0A7I8VRQ2_9ANNE|nr:DgyrCDS6773 [Dimorphilus gyrociliatus]